MKKKMLCLSKRIVTILLVAVMFFGILMSVMPTEAATTYSDVLSKYGSLHYVGDCYDGDESSYGDSSKGYKCYRRSSYTYMFFTINGNILVKDEQLISRLLKCAVALDADNEANFLVNYANDIMGFLEQAETVHKAQQLDEFIEEAAKVVQTAAGAFAASVLTGGEASVAAFATALAKATKEEIEEYLTSVKTYIEKFSSAWYGTTLRHCKELRTRILSTGLISKSTTSGAEAYYNYLMELIGQYQIIHELQLQIIEDNDKPWWEVWIESVFNVATGFAGTFFNNMLDKTNNNLKNLDPQLLKKLNDFVNMAKKLESLGCKESIEFLVTTYKQASTFGDVTDVVLAFDNAVDRVIKTMSEFEDGFNTVKNISLSCITDFPLENDTPTPTPSRTPTPSTTTYTTGTYKVITTDSLWLRSKPSTSGTGLAGVPGGTTVVVTEVSGKWGKISFNGTLGWICLEWEGDPYVQKISNSTSSGSTTNPGTVVSRDDGTWFFPLNKAYYRSFSDWAGCPGMSKCPFHGVNHYGDDYHTSQQYGHNGFDVAVSIGTPVYAAASGNIYRGKDDERGNYVVIEHPIDGNYSYYSYYQHLSKNDFYANGTSVSVGDKIAESGNSGYGSGAHFHFGIVRGKSGLSISNIFKLENNGWLITATQQEGRIVNNPDITGPSGAPQYYWGGDNAGLTEHQGSTKYTFNASEVKIGGTIIAPTFSTIDLGTYYIKTKDGKYVYPTVISTNSIDTPLTVSGSKADKMKFDIISVGSNYSIKSHFNSADNRLNVYTDGNPSKGNAITIWPNTNHISQQWKFIKVGNAYAIVSAANTSLAITIENNKTYLNNYTGADNQLFFLETECKTHNYTYTKQDDTNHEGTCTACGHTVQAAHAWDSGVVTTQPSHVKEGVKTFTCTACKATKTESIAKTTSHAYGAWAKHDNNQHVRSCECGEKEYANHTWDGGVVTTQPSHVKEGVKIFTCTACKATKTESIAKTTSHAYGAWAKHDNNQHVRSCECGEKEYANHTWDSGVVTTQPSHVKEGVKTFTCTACKATKTESIAKTTSHAYGVWAKCDNNQHVRTCECGDKQLANHNWNSGTVTTQATCAADGVRTYTCTDCGATKTEAIAKHNNHTWDNGTQTKSPTCVNVGEKTYTCTVCKTSRKDAIPATGVHIYGSWTTGNANDHAKVCSECKNTVTEHHAWDNGVIVKNATENADGEMKYTCTVCSGTKSVAIPAKGHTHNYSSKWTNNGDKHWHECNCGAKSDEAAHKWNSGVITKQPTCAANGEKTFSCTVCGKTKTESVPNNSNHIWNSGVITKQPTCAAQGEKTYTCSGCGKTKSEAIAKSGTHNWNSGVQTSAPTCTKSGEVTTTCTTCGATKVSIVPATRIHTYGTWSTHTEQEHIKICTVCGDKEKASHSWDDGIVTLPATETTEGVHKFTCSDCGQTKENVIPVSGHEHKYTDEWVSDSNNHWHQCACGDIQNSEEHTWDAGVLKTEVTCTSDGLRVYTCTTCGTEKNEVLRGGHIPTDWLPEGESSCNAPGKEVMKCVNCGEVLDERDVPAGAHQPGEWITVTEPTCNADGLKQQLCTLCGENVRYEMMPATGHQFDVWKILTLPTETAKGELVHFCSCGFSEIAAIDKLTTSIKNESENITVTPKDDTVLPVGTTVQITDIQADAVEEIKKAVQSIAENASMLGLFDITLMFENGVIQPDGDVIVTLPMPKDAVGKYQKYSVVYIDAENKVHFMPTDSVDGDLKFTTNHFSKYAIVGVGDEDSGSREQMPIIYVILITIAAMLVLFAVAVILFNIIKHRRYVNR